MFENRSVSAHGPASQDALSPLLPNPLSAITLDQTLMDIIIQQWGKSLKQIESSRGGDCYLAQSYTVSNIFAERQVQIPPRPKRLMIVHALKAKTAASIRRRSMRPAHTLITLSADRAVRYNKCLQLQSLWGGGGCLWINTDEAGAIGSVDDEDDDDNEEEEEQDHNSANANQGSLL